MWFAFGKVVRVNIDDIATDRLTGNQRQRQIFQLFVNGEIAFVCFFVDRPLVDRIRTRMIDNFAKKPNDDRNK